MSIFHGFDHAAQPKPPAADQRDLAYDVASPLAGIVWGLILAVTLLSFYVQVLNEQVQRGNLLRQVQRVPIVKHVMPGPDGRPAPAKATFQQTTAY